jgi:hypothetical protein
MIDRGAHPGKYTKSGVTIVPIGEQEKSYLPKNEADMAVYPKYALQRMENLMNLSMLSQSDKDLFYRKVADMRKVIEGNPSFSGMKAVTENHSSDLLSFANKYKVPAELVLSLALIENGGAEGMVSPAGARGVLQVMPDLLNDKLASRNITRDSFEALSAKDQDKLLIEFGVENLSDMYNLFGDWGIAVWAHHGGQGSVYWALKEYFGEKYDADNLPLGGYPELQRLYKSKIAEAQRHGFNYFTLLGNPRVQRNVITHLVDETGDYTDKAITANVIINEQMPNLVQKSLLAVAPQAPR